MMKEDVQLKNVLEATFRANPNYELVLFDRLPLEQQVLLADLQEDPDLYGVLRPRQQPSPLALKSVCQNTALLYFSLQQPGRLPAYVKARLGQDGNQTIAELVLDGVLEIEQEGTEFVCGSDAYGLLYEARDAVTGNGTVARLSIEALQYAQALQINDIPKLSARMYYYNRLPASPAWRRRLPTPEAVARHLGIQEGGQNWRMLHRHWASVPLSPSLDGWHVWRLRQRERRSAQPGTTYKLYVSPTCEVLGEVFGAILDLFTSVQATRFKVGRDVYGLLRPDKLIAYLESFEHVQEAASGLQRRLEGCPAQGVPFTAEITGDGLLSWGMDPPRDQQVLSWQERESWRLWLTNRLAVALVAAKAAQSATIAPWQFAMQRLELEGVNTTSWTPAQAIWDEE